MKRLIYLSLLLISQVVIGQRVTDNNTRVGYTELRANGMFHLPEDTVLSPSVNANKCQQIAKKDGAVYQYSCSAGKWVKIIDAATVILDSAMYLPGTGEFQFRRADGSVITIQPGYVDSLLNRYTKAQADARFLQENQIVTLGGDITGTGKTAITTTLKNTGTAGTYAKVTTDAQGRVTSGTTLSAGDIPSLSSTYIPVTQRAAVNGVATLGATGKIPTSQISLTTSDVPEGMSLYFSNARVQSFGDTRYALLSRSLSVGTGLTGGGDLTSDRSFNLDFSYLDDRYLSGYKQRAAVRVATTANITLSAAQTIDGVSVVAGDRVLVKNQTTASQNGIYIAASGSWTRAADFDQGAAGEIEQGSQIFVQEGTTNNKTGWSLSTGGTITVDVTALAFIQYSGANSYSAGGGLSLSGNTFSAQNASSLWNANKLQNIGLSTTAPTSSQLLRYDGSNWAPWSPNYLTGELDAISQSKTVAVAAGTGISVTGGAQTVGNNPAFTVALNATTSNVPEGSNLYWTNARGDARYPLLSGAYANPSWLTSLPWSKITGSPTTLAGYGITDAAPATGSGNYVQNQIIGPQSSANLWLSGQGNMQRLATSAATAVGQWNMYNGSGQGNVGNLRFVTSLVNAESTGNAGSDYTISRYSDAGGLISTALSITRSTGIVNMPSGFKALAVNGSSGLLGNSNTPASVQSYLSYYQADGTTRLGYSGIINGDAYLTADNGNVNLRPGGSNAVFQLTPVQLGLSTGTLALNNASANTVLFGTGGVAAPSFTTRSAGTKITLYPGISSSTADYAMGMETGHMWNSTPQNTPTMGFKWYGGTSLAARLGSNGQLEVGGQGRFQGWYVSGAANWNGQAAEIGITGGNATFIGYDRTNNYFIPVAINGGSSSGTANSLKIDGTGYQFISLPNVASLGTNASGYLINTSANFLQNQTAIAQSGAGFWTSGAGTATTFATVGLPSTTPDFLMCTGSSAAGANGRWRISRTVAEATGNVGNDFIISRMDNAGTIIGNPVYIKRSTGVVTLTNGLSTSIINAQATNDLDLGVDASQNYRFSIGGNEKVTITKDGILSVGNSSASTIRASPLQVQGNVWSTDAYILGTGNAPTAEFGLSGTADAFVRTMGTGNLTFQTNAGTTRATVNGTTGNFEIANQVKILGGTPGAGKVLTSDASGLATWSSGNVPAIRSITASYTATTEDRTIINRATTGTPTLTLPAASTNVGREYVIVEESANPTANGLVFSPGVVYKGTTYTSWVNAVLSSTSRITVQSDGTNWIIISQP